MMTRGKGFIVVLFALAAVFRGLSEAASDKILTTNVLPPTEDGSALDRRLLPSVGNGEIATTVWADTVYIDGVYNGKLGESHRARIQSLHSSQFNVVGGCSETPKAPIQTTFKLDAQQGVVSQETVCAELSLTHRVYAHQVLSSVLVTELELSYTGSDHDSVKVARTDLSGDESDEFDWEDVDCSVAAKCYLTGTTKVAETDSSDPTTVHIFYNEEVPGELSLPSGEDEVTFFYVMAMGEDKDLGEAQFDEAMKDLEANVTAFRKEHTDVWDDKWQQGDILLEGSELDPTLDQTVFTSLYYIYSSLPAMEDPGDTFYGLSPGGLANGAINQDYQGHGFWDMESWMYPPILMLRADLAREMLNYRLTHIDTARERAASGGYNGARFPWESARTGVDVCPDLCIPCRENEQHITGDVSLAARNLIAMNRHDPTWLTGEVENSGVSGLDLVLDMAKFWESRPEFNEETQFWDINHIMPPDEYHEDVNNSIFTNVVAEYSVTTGRWAACLAAAKDDPATAADSAREAVPDDWLNKMAALTFTYNAEGRFHEEYENMNVSETVKQADVVMLNYPLLWSMPEDVMRNDLELYENITTQDGPAMIWGVFVNGWLDLGELEKAAELFDRTYLPFVREPFGVWTEAREGTGAVNFITGAGGFLQTLLSGYGGLRIRPYSLQYLAQSGSLPPTVDKMTFKDLDYLGNKLDLALTVDDVTLTCTSADAETAIDLEIEFENETETQVLDCDKSTPVTVPRKNFHIVGKGDGMEEACEPPNDRFEGAVYEEEPSGTTTTTYSSGALQKAAVSLGTTLAAMVVIELI